MPPPKISVTPEMLNSILKGITKNIKKKFKLVPQIRDVRNPIQHRMTLIDSQLQSSLWALDQSTKDPDEQIYSDIETTFRAITERILDPAHGEIFIT